MPSANQRSQKLTVANRTRGNVDVGGVPCQSPVDRHLPLTNHVMGKQETAE